MRKKTDKESNLHAELLVIDPKNECDQDYLSREKDLHASKISDHLLKLSKENNQINP